MRILFAVSEVFPLIKTGGLADVAYNLPAALQGLGHDVGIVLPAYKPLLPLLEQARPVTNKHFAGEAVEIWHTHFGSDRLNLWLIHCPRYFDREGGPYGDYSQQSWLDNAERFGLFCRVIAAMAAGEMDTIPRYDILHCNDWQTGLAPVFLQQHKLQEKKFQQHKPQGKTFHEHKQQEQPGPKTVFTIHNLAYQGVFPRADFDRLGLPEALWQFSQLEFYDCFSFIKGGIVFADTVTTVSPQYRREILTPEFGCGLDGCLNYHREKLAGILNGIDTTSWNPETDPDIAHHFNANTLDYRRENKRALINRFHLTKRKDTLLLGFVGRLTEQKGLDLVIDALPQLLDSQCLDMPVQIIFLGDGDGKYRDLLDTWRHQHGEKVGAHFGHAENLAHQFMAGLDALLIPSRYEPCGLTQMYAMRYGCVPIAHAVGGLVDTIVDTDTTGTPATGFLFKDYTVDSLVTCIERAIKCFKQQPLWRSLQRNGMQVDTSWHNSAQRYEEIYQNLITEPNTDRKKTVGELTS